MRKLCVKFCDNKSMRPDKDNVNRLHTFCNNNPTVIELKIQGRMPLVHKMTDTFPNLKKFEEYHDFSGNAPENDEQFLKFLSPMSNGMYIRHVNLRKSVTRCQNDTDM